MSELNVTATRWEGGWELEIEPDQHTSVRSLAKARQQVVDFLDTVTPEVNHSTWTINIIPCLGGLEQAVRAAKQSTAQAALLSANAAKQSRNVARQLRNQGYTVADCAVILGVSRSRVSQLVNS
ncbi:antitoxin HicB [Mobiluncus mulieris]|uniref:Antitoxin HicB n=1 Tax=Mobiluncus mulieris TaxID=2052 RepID=A0A7Y0Y366_9ACTO|nr:antitoxin HicB [Mobiluncus mulieris]NMW64096.1 antitoxin HicB [Mobiluncus mulieris]